MAGRDESARAPGPSGTMSKALVSFLAPFCFSLNLEVERIGVRIRWELGCHGGES